MKKHYKFFPKNEHGRDFVIGDIHGCLKEFNKKLEEIEFDKTRDRMFSVGDLADRGPDSIKTIQLLHEPWLHSVKGNHEILMEQAHTMDNYTNVAIYMQNGGEWLPDDIREEVLSEISQLPYMIEIETPTNRRVGIVHAQVPPMINDWLALKTMVETNDVDGAQLSWFGPLFSLVWGRERIDKYKAQQDKDRVYPNIKNIDEIFVGHTILPDPVKHEKHHYIDTGAFLPYWVSPERLNKMIKYQGYNPRLTVKEIT